MLSQTQIDANSFRPLFSILSFICFSFFSSSSSHFAFCLFCKKSFLILSSSLSQEIILFIEYLFCIFFFIGNLFCVLFICLYNPFSKIIAKTLLCTLLQKELCNEITFSCFNSCIRLNYSNPSS